MRTVLKLYQTLLKKYPMTSQAVQTGILMGTGDVLAQTAVEKRKLMELDYMRVVRFACVGTCLVGPALYTWYGFMERRIGSTGVKTLLKKVAADQLLFAPSFIAVLITTLGVSEGLPLDTVIQKVKATYTDILITNYKLWPAVQLCNFYVVPFEYRVLVVQIVAIFWNTYLSWKTNSSYTTKDGQSHNIPEKTIQN